MKIFRLPSILFLMLSLCGCIHLPSTSQQLPSGAALPAVGKASATTGSSHAIQIAVNYTATLSILGGLACLAFGGLAIYGGQLLAGIKLVIAGLLLPIAGIYWAYHWLFMTIFILIGLAAFLLLTHYAIIRPVLVSIETWMKTVEARLGATSKASPAVPAAVLLSPTPHADMQTALLGSLGPKV